MMFFTVLGQVLIVVGGLVFLSAALGLIRFPDTYTRISAVGTASGIGIVFAVVGAFLLEPDLSSGVKVVAIVFLQLATSAIGSMAIARAAYVTGTPMRVAHEDELDQAVTPDHESGHEN